MIYGTLFLLQVAKGLPIPTKLTISAPFLASTFTLPSNLPQQSLVCPHCGKDIKVTLE